MVHEQLTADIPKENGPAGYHWSVPAADVQTPEQDKLLPYALHTCRARRHLQNSDDLQQDGEAESGMADRGVLLRLDQAIARHRIIGGVQ